MSAFLRPRNFPLEVSVEPGAIQAVSVAGTCKRLQTEINTHSRAGRGFLCPGDSHEQAQPPIADRILGKAALTPRHTLEALRFKDPNSLATESQGATCAAQTGCFKRHPTQRSSWAAGDSPPELCFPTLTPLDSVFAVDSLDRISPDPLHKRGRASGQSVEIETGQPFRRSVIRTGCL